MKRLFAVLLAAVMLFSMAGCDNLKVESIEPTPMPPVETETPAPKESALGNLQWKRMSTPLFWNTSVPPCAK